MPSPLLLGGLLYFTKDRVGFLTCFDAASGKVHYSNKRLQGIRIEEQVNQLPAAPSNAVQNVPEFALGKKRLEGNSNLKPTLLFCSQS